LPPPTNPKIKKTLFLDIDETMIHCLDERDGHQDSEVVIRIPLDEYGDYADAGVNIRPHLVECLRQANELYQVVAFTASDSQYANAILDHIDPKKELIQHRLSREHCIETEFGYVKDLRIIANRHMHEMILVDNSVLSFAL
jgi:Dullard-like phosphatase family protein